MNKNKLSPADIEATIVGENYTVHGVLTVCILTLRNGFQVVGKSGCVDPANFNAEIGRQIARTEATNQVWMLEGYLLRQKMFEAGR